ncbi:MarR family winged helix-turn-helix transcriptional regulator [Streptomyces sp. NPDC048644]|uniref:MarR family winged helix-turn-helix transcriptional regulator n=1 Tax=Streptomyces sp. NPDC048644 TaxID=3365582 RepID=UPI0037141C2B
MDVKRPATAPPEGAPGPARQDPATAPGGPIREQLRNLTLRQQRFERYLGRRMEVDAAGLAVMDHLVNVGPTTPTDLARRLDASTAATTLVIDRLVAAGHVTRGPHPTDRRKVIVTPDDHWGAAAFEHVAPVIQGVTEAADALSPDEQAVVAAFLERIVGVYDQATKT